MAVYVYLRISHKLFKFIIGSNLTQEPVVDTAAFQQRHHFIRQMQFHQRRVGLLSIFCPAQQIINGHLIEVCQRDKVAVVDFLIVVGFIAGEG